MLGKFVGSTEIEDESLAQMRERGGRWAVYQNHDLGSSQVGHIQFLQYGPERTHKAPPAHMPDSASGLGWRYLFVGYVDLPAGRVVENEV